MTFLTTSRRSNRNRMHEKKSGPPKRKSHEPYQFQRTYFNNINGAIEIVYGAKYTDQLIGTLSCLIVFFSFGSGENPQFREDRSSRQRPFRGGSADLIVVRDKQTENNLWIIPFAVAFDGS